ncbi:sulfur-oxidizing protein SoxB [Polynucleobacter sphagniphilus]|uniref:thiosulfohydrolase SoxB n=1 Tax=Polynucleobacter sphagniphilus TaxID=1743169 RepID=UPI0024772504|nr:thiosulfohydrolase SoxB [Polynucleobacter sphagniphilus]MDH6249486.1 sulfur-oxidizing protein SoxB [Polynucleobacter sphagniphilus]
MSLERRDFLKALAIASAGGLSLHSNFASAQQTANAFYELPRFGNVHLLHFTDCHAQLLPVYFREPNVNIGVGSQKGKTPHLVGEYFLKANNIPVGTKDAYAFTYLNFDAAAQHYGRMGGFAHLSTLIQQIKANRPGSLLLDGGDTWQGSATALWTKGQDMVDASLLLGVDIMTAHWEMTLGENRVLEIVEKDFQNKISFLAQNIKTTDFGDDVFTPFVIREMNGVPVAIIGQAFPYTPVANPRYFTPNWTFGIQESNLQKTIDLARSQGAKVVVLLSHNGMDVDLKLASRVRGIDAILGGHTHDGVPIPVQVRNAGGTTLVTNAGSNGKFLGVLDFDVKGGHVVDFQYKLLPVFSDLLPADPRMSRLIERVRQPYESVLSEPLAVTQELLYRRGNFNGSFDQVILDGLLTQKNAEIAFSPGFRWGTTLLPGQVVTMENLMDQTAITYPYTTNSLMSGQTIKTILEDVADNLFNPDPYYQQGGDMVRVGGLNYAIDPNASMGNRISDMRLNGTLLDPHKSYRVAGWAPVSEDADMRGGEAIWDLMRRHLKEVKVIEESKLNEPLIKGVKNNPGIESLI